MLTHTEAPMTPELKLLLAEFGDANFEYGAAEAHTTEAAEGFERITKTRGAIAVYLGRNANVDREELHFLLGSLANALGVDIWNAPYPGNQLLEASRAAYARIEKLEALVKEQSETITENTKAMAIGCRFRAALEIIRDTDPNLSHAVAAVHMQAIATNALVNP